MKAFGYVKAKIISGAELQLEWQDKLRKDNYFATYTVLFNNYFILLPIYSSLITLLYIYLRTTRPEIEPRSHGPLPKSLPTRQMGRFGLVWFYGVSTTISYSIPNPVFTYILNIRFINAFFATQLNDQTVIFLTILSSITKINGSRYCNISLTIQLKTSHLFIHTQFDF